MILHTESPVLDAVLKTHADALGGDFTAYRNHAYRVMNLCLALSPTEDESTREKVAIAAAFHDIGIWAAHTFDYIAPSVRLAEAHLGRTKQAQWAQEIETMIELHHKLSRYRARADWLVEPFRKADLVDLSGGAVAFGLSRRLVKELFTQWPSAGFHKRLVRLALGRLITNPFDPLPMVRL